MTLYTAIKNYLSGIDKDNTRASYEDTFRRLENLFEFECLDIKASQVSEILKALPVSKHTKYLRFTHIKALFNGIFRDMRIAGYTGPLINPCTLIALDFKKPKVNGKPIPEGYDQTVSDFIHGLKPRHQMIARIGSNAGLRIGEILRIRPCDLITRGKYAFFQINDPKSGANLELRNCPIDIAKELKEYIEKKDIGTHDRIFPLTPQAVNATFRKYGFASHDMRRYAAYKAQDRGINIKGIQGMLGHSSVVTTEKYLNSLSPMALAKTLEPMNGG